jgi:hypothetical protein
VHDLFFRVSVGTPKAPAARAGRLRSTAARFVKVGTGYDVTVRVIRWQILNFPVRPNVRLGHVTCTSRTISATPVEKPVGIESRLRGRDARFRMF